MSKGRWWADALDHSLSRRRLASLAAKGSVVGAAVALGVSPGLPRILRAEDVEGAWIARWPLETERFADGRLTGLFVGPDGGLRVTAGRGDGTYVSRTTSTTRDFNLLGVNFETNDTGLGRIAFEARVSDDGESWSDWYRLPFEHAFAKGKAPGDEVPSTEPLLADGRYFQLRITLRAGAQLHAAEVNVIGVEPGPPIEQVLAGARSRMGLSKDAPVEVLSRADWGANESWRFNSSGAEIWPPAYVAVTKFLVHHTVTANSQSGLTQLRAVYAYHALSRQWGDIGYNYLLDTRGNMYEGRAGGGNVVGGHALLFNWGSIGIGNLGTFSDPGEYPGGMRPTAAQLGTLQRFIARRCFDREIDPEGHGVYWNYDVPNVMGHRDANNKCEGCSTSCPGNYLYFSLPSIRRASGAIKRPDEAVMWLAHTVQGDYYTREKRADVTIQAKNTGSKPWLKAGASAMEIVASWHTLRGEEYTAEGGGIVSTAVMPYDVAAGREVYLPLTLRLPERLGQYHLKVTMRRKGARSFFDAGHASYDLRVNMQSQVPFVAPPSLRVLMEAGTVSNTPILIDGDGQPWTATTDSDAVRVVPDEGSAPNRVSVRCDATDVEPGAYDITVTWAYVDAAGSAQTATTALRLIVRERVQRTFFPATRS